MPTCSHEIVPPCSYWCWMHPVCSFMLFCVCAHAYPNSVCVFWSGLIFLSIPLPWHEGWREAGVVVRRGTRGPVRVEVQEQVEVWILNIEKLHQGSIFAPMATALKWEDGDGLSASSIPQTWLKGKCKELFNWVLQQRFSELKDNYLLSLSPFIMINVSFQLIFIII